MFLISDEGQKLFVEEGLLPANKKIEARESLQKELEGVKFFYGAPEIVAREVSENGDKWREKIQKIYQREKAHRT